MPREALLKGAYRDDDGRMIARVEDDRWAYNPGGDVYRILGLTRRVEANIEGVRCRHAYYHDPHAARQGTLLTRSDHAIGVFEVEFGGVVFNKIDTLGGRTISVLPLPPMRCPEDLYWRSLTGEFVYLSMDYYLGSGSRKLFVGTGDILQRVEMRRATTPKGSQFTRYTTAAGELLVPFRVLNEQHLRGREIGRASCRERV